MPAVQMGGQVLKETLKRADIRPIPGADAQQLAPARLADQGMIELERGVAEFQDNGIPLAIDEVIMGNVLQAGQGQNPARQAMIAAGIPKETPALSINKVCGSGLKAIAIGAAAIMCGNADAVLAGGMENMSQVPMALPHARWGHRMELTGVGEVHDLMVFDGLYEIFYGYHMGVTAENIAELYTISREEQDSLAVLSHQRAMEAQSAGWFKEEIVPLTIKSRKGDIIFDTDERPMQTDLAKMAKLRPVFKREGTVTAGNASGINDAAAAVLLTSAAKAQQLGLQPLATIKGFASGGLDPAFMGLGPVPAVRKVLGRCRMNIENIDMIELNEAFAAQAIGCIRELGIEVDQPNQLGSGISLGHPIGCTGARQVVTAVHHMQRRDYSTGLISMCIGGGMGMAMIIER
jgi:acetyl-CoA C-acetyltransferase